MQQPPAVLTHGSSHRRTRVALDTVIQGIKLANGLVPVELAKGIMSAVSGVLSLVQVSTDRT